MKATGSEKTKLKSDVASYVTDMLDNIIGGKTLLKLPKGGKVFSQGDPASAIYFLQIGKVRITVLSLAGKEIVLAMPGPRSFFGEGCLAGQTVRMSTATAIRSSTLFRVEGTAMLQALHTDPELAQKFTAELLARSIVLKKSLCDQLLNHSEKRLARVLLKLARVGLRDTLPAVRLPPMSHETLAEMVGATAAQVTHFMNKFRTLGLIDYSGKEITVRAGLMTDMVLQD